MAITVVQYQHVVNGKELIENFVKEEGFNYLSESPAASKLGFEGDYVIFCVSDDCKEVDMIYDKLKALGFRPGDDFKIAYNPFL